MRFEPSGTEYDFPRRCPENEDFAMREGELQPAIAVEATISMSFLRDVMVTILTQGLSGALALAFSAVAARLLGPDGNGTFTLLILIATMLTQLSNLGIGTSNTYLTAVNKYSRSAIVGNTLCAMALLSATGAFLMAVALQFPQFVAFTRSSGIPNTFLWLMVGTLPLNLGFLFFGGIIQGRREFMVYNGLQLVRFTAQLGLLPFLMEFLPDRLTGAVCAYLAALLISCFACWWLVSRRIRTTLRLNMDLLLASISYGLKAYSANLLHFLNTRLNVFIVAFFLGATAVGQYAVGLVIVEALCLAAGSIGQILFPTVAAAGPGPIANQLTARVIRQVVFFMTLLCAGVALIAEPVIKLTLGSLYLPSVQPLLLLLPGALALSIPKVLSQDLAGRGRPEFALFAAAVSLVIGLPLNLWLIPRWGISGAALSSTVAYTCTTLVILCAFSQCSGNSWRDVLLIRRSDLLSYGGFLKWVTRAE